MPKDPFDFTDVSDLPEEMRDGLANRKGRPEGLHRQILALVNQSGQGVKAAEVRAAYYRTHGVELKKSQVVNALRNLHTRQLLKKEDLGVYSPMKSK